jgi:hypothetical protein
VVSLFKTNKILECQEELEDTKGVIRIHQTHVRGKKKAYTSAKIMIYSGSGPVV